MRRRYTGLHVSLLALALVLAAAPEANGQVAPPLGAACDDLEVTRANANFARLRDLRKVDPSAVSLDDFRRAASRYVLAAEACYDQRYGAAASPPTQIDGGGLRMDSGGVAEFVTFGTKWGAGSPYPGGPFVGGPGLPGGLVTWAYMPDNVDMSAEGVTPNVAIQSLATFQGCFESEVQLAFDAWSAAADIQFQRIADDGVPFNFLGAIADIRVGAHPFDGPFGTLAHGYFPPPNGASAAGDIHFDLAENWDCVDTGPQFDIGIVMIHEIGHAIGLEHQSQPPIAIMNAFYSPVVMALQPDDITGAESIYGAALGCSVTLTLTYDSGNLTMDFVLASDFPTTFNVWATAGNVIQPFWSTPLPAISVPFTYPVTLPIPPLGTMGILTTLTTPADGIACSSFETVDTSPD